MIDNDAGRIDENHMHVLAAGVYERMLLHGGNKHAVARADGLRFSVHRYPTRAFDDRVGYSAIVLEGRYPQAHMKNQLGRELCLWQRAKQKAFIVDADTLLKTKK